MVVKARYLILGGLLLLVAACSSEGRKYNENPRKALKATQEYLSENAYYGGQQQLATLSTGRIDLGKKLFFDKRLSGSGNVSCATCHNPDQGYTQNGRALPPGAAHISGGRNAPSLYDVVARRHFFHDGRAYSLETQVTEPLMNPAEMANGSLPEMAARVRALKDYERFYSYAFGAPANEESIAISLSAYQRTLVTGPSRFDLWKYQGRKRVLDEDEVRGYALFTGKAGCGACHLVGLTSAPLTDEKFHDTGYAATKPATFAQVDTGRHQVTGNEDDMFAFRTPSLRNVALTAPYMHDGRLPTLHSVVSFFDQSSGLGLSSQEKKDLVAFLESLTSLKRP